MFAGQEIKSKGGEAFGSGTAQPSGCWGGCQSSWPMNPKDIHSAGVWQSPNGSSLWPLPCSDVQHGSQEAHMMDRVCNTRRNKAKQEGTLCHLFQSAGDMVWFLPGW